MKRLNNKGFAITTIVYGLAIMSTMILTLVMSMLANTRRNTSDLSKTIEQELIRFSKTSILYDYQEAGHEDQEFIVPEGEAGWYRIELWGAQGGGNNGGLGAYTSGIIRLNEGQKLHFVVGKQGTDATGGGATDVRLESPSISGSVKTRIMVAAGGGKQPNSHGGTLYGYTNTMVAPGGKIKVKQDYKLAENTTLLGYEIIGSSTTMMGFDVGQTGTPNGKHIATGPGGEGYITSTNENYGGVSFISGYIGSKAVNASNVLTNDARYQYPATGTVYYFVDGMMLPGVKEGNGQAKIERIVSGETNGNLPVLNEKLNNISKVRDCISNTNVKQNIKSIAVSIEGQTVTGTLTNDSSVSGSVCKVLDLGANKDVDEIAVFHDPGYDYYNHTISVYKGGSWIEVKKTTPYGISETETATGYRISAYQPDYTNGIPKTGNYYLMPVTSESKVVSGFSSSEDRANPLEINPLVGEVRQKWSIELIPAKISNGTDLEYKIVELTRYNALTIYKDENLEGNHLIVSAFNNLARNDPSIWKIIPMGDGTVVITSSAKSFYEEPGKVSGNVYAQTNSDIVDTCNTLAIGLNENSTQRFKLIKLDY